MPEVDGSRVDVEEVDEVSGHEEQRLRVQHVKVVAQHAVVPEGIARKQKQKTFVPRSVFWIYRSTTCPVISGGIGIRTQTLRH